MVQATSPPGSLKSMGSPYDSPWPQHQQFSNASRRRRTDPGGRRTTALGPVVDPGWDTVTGHAVAAAVGSTAAARCTAAAAAVAAAGRTKAVRAAGLRTAGAAPSLGRTADAGQGAAGDTIGCAREAAHTVAGREVAAQAEARMKAAGAVHRGSGSGRMEYVHLGSAAEVGTSGCDSVGSAEASGRMRSSRAARVTRVGYVKTGRGVGTSWAERCPSSQCSGRCWSSQSSGSDEVTSAKMYCIALANHTTHRRLVVVPKHARHTAHQAAQAAAAAAVLL